MLIQQLQSILSECQSDPQAIAYLLQQGIEAEELRLQFFDPIHTDTIESFTKIMNGERFLSLLIATGLSQ